MSTTSRQRPAAKTAAKRPDDKPFDFNLDAATPPRDLQPFVFTWKNRRWTMQHIEELDVWDLSEAIDKGEIAAMTTALRLALGKDWEAFRNTKFPQWRFKALFREYRQHCGYNADGTSVDGGDDL